ncbi:MAG: heme NO-binding domain-containing protein, partial [Lysobacterales bacterium]
CIGKRGERRPMQGIVFQVLEACYVDAFGPDEWLEVVDAAGTPDNFTYSADYADADLGKLVASIAEAQDLTPVQVLRWFGEHAIPHFHDFAPDLFDCYRACWPFLRSLNDIIHPQVRQRYPGADVPDFEYPDATGDAQIITYRSPRRMCAFAEGLMLGAAAHFGEQLAIVQSRCMHQGDDHCRFELRFATA